MDCAVCGTSNSLILRSVTDLARECRIRERFVRARLGHRPDGLEAMDLTHFAHEGPAEIAMCSTCRAIRRVEEHAAQYESDAYDPALMRFLYPRYRQAFSVKRPNYEPLLRSGAEVVEIGSHMGAFLETAEAWGWRPVGVDIGRDTSTFARRQGCTVRHISFTDYSPKQRPDAIFIWNCFEQLENVWDVMIHARRVLSHFGLLILRVPNAEFYRMPDALHFSRALGYNNLLGFPYLNGYSLEILRGLLASTGFETIAALPTSVLTPPYPEMSKQVRNEWQRVRRETERHGVVNSPWIEIVGRATERTLDRERAEPLMLSSREDARDVAS